MNVRQFVRLAKWARHPPSRRQRRIVGVVLVMCAALLAVEWLFGWPEALTVNRVR